MSARPPLVHEVARRWCQWGGRFVSPVWGTARRWPFPPRAEIQLAPGIRFDLDLSDDIGFAIYRGLFERPETQIVASVLRPGQTAVDVGANIGYHTALMGRAVGPDGRVIAVEPSPTVLPSLRRLCTQARLSNVAIFDCALGAATGEGRLGLAEHGNAGLSSMRPGFVTTESAAVAVRTLDDLVGQEAPAGVSLVKIDVEGWEDEVLSGATTLLTERKVAVWLLEVSPEFGSLEWFADLLRAIGESYAAFRLGIAARGLRVIPVLTPIGSKLPDRQVNVLLLRHDTPLDGVIYATDGS